MNRDAIAILCLCSHLCKASDAKPLTPTEWGRYARILYERGLRPADLAGLSVSEVEHTLVVDEKMAQRVCRLLEREGSLAFEIARYENMGVHAITRADDAYPKKLRHALQDTCPPVLYAVGNLELLGNPAIGFVGSRSIGEEDEAFAASTVERVASAGFGVVSGGARGVDSVSAAAALDAGVSLVEYLGHSLQKHARRHDRREALMEGRAVALSSSVPDAGFSAGALMGRNKYIYAHSQATVVVRSDKGSGGTWSGATEAMRKGLCPVLCQNRADYEGNQALLALGAIPVDDTWDGDPRSVVPDDPQPPLFG